MQVNKLFSTYILFAIFSLAMVPFLFVHALGIEFTIPVSVAVALWAVVITLCGFGLEFQIIEVVGYWRRVSENLDKKVSDINSIVQEVSGEELDKLGKQNESLRKQIERLTEDLTNSRHDAMQMSLEYDNLAERHNKLFDRLKLYEDGMEEFMDKLGFQVL